MAFSSKFTQALHAGTGLCRTIGRKVRKALGRQRQRALVGKEEEYSEREHHESSAVAQTTSSSQPLSAQRNETTVVLATPDQVPSEAVRESTVSTHRLASSREVQRSYDITWTVQRQDRSSSLREVSAQLSRGSAPVIKDSVFQTHSSAGSRTFALVIGINEYMSHRKPQLRGAVNDALQMHRLLQRVFGVPDSNIRLLCDQEATRKRIISGFESLINNPNIQRGDAIIIFFAGHGSRAHVPRSWNAEGDMVETLCPVDEEFRDGDREIHGIPDRTISGLVHALSKKKGENITLIFDCCHAGGIARGDAPKQPCRSAQTDAHLPADLDKELWKDLPPKRGGSRSKGFLYSLANYVLLAACRSNEEARETDSEGKPCGVFSKALFHHLRLSGPATTYYDIARAAARDLKDFVQHPICEGEHKNHTLFNGMAVRQDAKLFGITNDGGGGYSVDAGEIHGITRGALFSISKFDLKSGLYKEIGVLEAQAVRLNHSILQPANGPSFHLPPDCAATVLSWGPSDHLLDVYLKDIPADWIQRTPQHYPRYRVASTRSSSTLVLRYDASKRITFERGSPVAEYSNYALQPSIKFSPQSLRPTLNRIGDFQLHLVRRNPSGPLSFMDQVRLRIHRLDETGVPGPNLFSDRRAGVTTGVDFSFTIVNESHLDLFPYLFFFDTTDYSIQRWYHPPAFNMAAPLRAANGGVSSALQVGLQGCPFGPFEFTIPKGARSDTGFLKLFLSTCPVDMDSLAQTSPFSTANPDASERTVFTRGGHRNPRSVRDMWDAHCYVVNIGHNVR